MPPLISAVLPEKTRGFYQRSVYKYIEAEEQSERRRRM